MVDAIRYAVRQLAQYPERVMVTCHTVTEKPVIEIKVAPADLGCLIGDEGRVFKALQGLVGLTDEQAYDVVIDVVDSQCISQS